MESINTRGDMSMPTRPATPSMLSWRAVAAGFVLSLLFCLILVNLGLAIGILSVTGVSTGGGSAQVLATGSRVWTLASVLASLFVGSYLASRICTQIPKRIGGIQGLVIAGLFFSFMTFQLTAALANLGSDLDSSFDAIAGWTFFGAMTLGSSFAFAGGRMGVHRAEHWRHVGDARIPTDRRSDRAA